MEGEQIKGTNWTAAIIAAILLIAVGYLTFIVRKIGIPVREQFATFSHGRASATFKMSEAKSIHPVLALEKGRADFDANTRPESEVSGEILIREGTNTVLRWSVQQATLQPCNWLASEGFATSFILDWGLSPVLAKTLIPGRVYQLEVQLQGVTNADASLWMSSIVANKDRSTASRMKVPTGSAISP